MSIFRIMINSLLIIFILILSSTVIAGEKNYECDINVMWVHKGNIHNKKKLIKLTSKKDSILIQGAILKFKFDKLRASENILIGIKTEKDKDFSSMSLRLDTMRYKAMFSFTSSIDGYQSEEYHYGNCFWLNILKDWDEDDE